MGRKDTMDIFAAAAFCDPAYFKLKNPSAGTAYAALQGVAQDSTTSRPHLITQDEVAKMIEELPVYKERVAIVDVFIREPMKERIEQVRSFWQSQKTLLPAWYAFMCRVAILSPSSAAVECSFSMFNGVFADNQQSALEDHPKLSAMLRFNGAGRARRERGGAAGRALEAPAAAAAPGSAK